MGTAAKATFVLSWGQTEVDGIAAAPTALLAVGATWRWSGQAVRVDGPADMLVLGQADGMEDLHRRAARAVRRLVGAALGPGPGLRRPRPEPDAADTAPEQGFSVTDGRRVYALTLVAVPGTGARLLVAVGDLPPTETDLWVVSASLAGAEAPRLDPDLGGVICFAAGTRIRCEAGLVPIEALRPGDRVMTRDNGAQPVIWTGARRMTGARLHVMPELRPVRLRAGAFGTGQPDADLIVSPRHRMLVAAPAALALFNTPEVLVAAEDLVDGRAVTVDLSCREVTYVHALFERHEVIWANGLPTESFHPAEAALDTLDAADRARLDAALPGILADPAAYGAHARRNLTAPEAAILRHDLAA
jgi:hypothetical protein